MTTFICWVPQVRRYQVLISLMLSSQTKDQVTASAMTRLKEHGLNVQNVITTQQRDIEDLIKPVGFYRVSIIKDSYEGIPINSYCNTFLSIATQRKAEYIKKATQLLSDKYGSDIPETLEGIVCSVMFIV